MEFKQYQKNSQPFKTFKENTERERERDFVTTVVNLTSGCPVWTSRLKVSNSLGCRICNQNMLIGCSDIILESIVYLSTCLKKSSIIVGPFLARDSKNRVLGLMFRLKICRITSISQDSTEIYLSEKKRYFKNQFWNL